jgi:flagellar biosynthesis anti-sigma factor FlgM
MNIRNGIDSLPQITQSQVTQSQVEPGSVSESSAPQSKVESNVQRISTPSTTSSQALAKDTAHLSSTATKVALSANESDVRLDKVASIRSQLEAGTYSVSAADVAKKVIDSITESNQ